MPTVQLQQMPADILVKPQFKAMISSKARETHLGEIDAQALHAPPPVPVIAASVAQPPQTAFLEAPSQVLTQQLVSQQQAPEGAQAPVPKSMLAAGTAGTTLLTNMMQGAGPLLK